MLVSEGALLLNLQFMKTKLSGYINLSELSKVILFYIKDKGYLTLGFPNVYRYSQTCLMWPSKGTVKFGHIS